MSVPPVPVAGPPAPLPPLPLCVIPLPDGPVCRSTRSTKGAFQAARYIDDAFLSSMGTTLLDPAGHAAQLAYLAELFTRSDTGDVK